MLRGARLFAVGICLFVFAAAIPAAASARVAGQSIDYRVEVRPDGQPPVMINIEEMGRGPVLLLLHGLGGSSYSWRHIAPILATSNRLVAIDMRGFGRSDKPFDQFYAPADHAAVVRAVIKQLRLAGVTLVGHSYGGIVALMLAMDHRLEPHRISKLVLMNVPAFPQPLTSAINFLRRPVLPYVVLNLIPAELPTAVAFMMESVGFDRLTQKDIAIYADPLMAPGGPHALISTAQQIVPPDLDRIVDRYPTITKPALVLWCRDDQVVPVSTGARLARSLPRARFAVIDGCDHVPPEQAPDRVASEMKRFLGR